MGVNFDRWTLLKLVEVALVIVCLIFKGVTDDEASRLFLYLQKLSREWSLLNNVTWSKVGDAVADATYGGYLIITTALFFGRLFGELPTRRRIIEFIFMGIGAILFIALGSLAFAALDSVPSALVDNAAIVGTLCLVTGALFLLDMCGPKAKPPTQVPSDHRRVSKSKPLDQKSITQQVYDIEKEIEKSERAHFDGSDAKKTKENGIQNGRSKQNGLVMEMEPPKGAKGYHQMKDDLPRRFTVYGRDVVDYDSHETDGNEDTRYPPKMEQHSPVWSHIRKGQYGKYDNISPPIVLPNQQGREEERPPSRPGDPGYVQYTAQHWGEVVPKTPRHSPTQV